MTYYSQQYHQPRSAQYLLLPLRRNLWPGPAHGLLLTSWMQLQPSHWHALSDQPLIETLESYYPSRVDWTWPSTSNVNWPNIRENAMMINCLTAPIHCNASNLTARCRQGRKFILQMFFLLNFRLLSWSSNTIKILTLRQKISCSSKLTSTCCEDS